MNLTQGYKWIRWLIQQMCVFFLSAHYALGRMWTLMNKAQSLPLKSESGGERQ